MTAVGPFISLDNETDTGERTNWCTTQTWWTSTSIQFTGTATNATAKVGNSVTIQVEARGSPIGSGGATIPCTISSIQAWVCYPNSVAGGGSSKLIVSSMNPAVTPGATPPTLPTPPAGSLFCLTGSANDNDPGDYVLTPWQSLTPVWVPTSTDFLDSVNGHVCVQVNLTGIFASARGDPSVDVGYPIPTNNLSEFNICNVPQQAQRNVTLYPFTLGKFPGPGIILHFPFISGIATGQRQGEGSFTLSVVQIVQQLETLDPVVKGIIDSSVYKELPLKGATLGTGAVSVNKFAGKCNEYVESILCEPSCFKEDHCGGKGMHVHVPLATGGEFVSVELEATLPEDTEVGTVYVFDLVQTNDTTVERGGYRIGLIAVNDD
jgi:hypothetical protein